MKKLLCGLLCLCVLFSLCGLGVVASEQTGTVTTITVETDGDSLKFTEREGSSATVDYNGQLQKASWEYKTHTLWLKNGAFEIEIKNISRNITITVMSGVKLQGLLDQGNDVTKIENDSGGTISIASDTIFQGKVENEDGSIDSGIFTGEVTNTPFGQISGGTFSGKVLNNGTITNGTGTTPNFSGVVENDGRITGGTFKGSELRNKSGGLISGGHFTETISVTNEAGGSITGGNFDTASPLQNNGAISGGSFHKVNNDGTISATEDRMPIFDFSVYNNKNGTISGGNFTQNCSVTNGASITGGTFSGTVYNSGSITGGTFAKDIVNNGGTVNLPQTNPDPAPVPQPVTPAPSEPVWDVEVEEEEEEIEVLKGSKQKYTQGADEGLSFRFDAKVKNFRRLKIDGKTVDKANYTVTEGSTIITLKPEYMDTLKAGKHTLKAIFKDGSAEVKFTVLEGAKVEVSAPAADADKLNPSTGANDFVGVAAALAVLSVGAAAALTMKKKKV